MAKDGNDGRKGKRTRVRNATCIRTNNGRIVPWLTKKCKRDRAPRTTNIHSLPKRLPRSTAKRSSMTNASTPDRREHCSGKLRQVPSTANTTTARVRTILRRMGQAEARRSQTRIKRQSRRNISGTSLIKTRRRASIFPKDLGLACTLRKVTRPSVPKTKVKGRK